MSPSGRSVEREDVTVAERLPDSAGKVPDSAGIVPDSAGIVPARVGKASARAGKVSARVGKVSARVGKVPAPAGNASARVGRVSALQDWLFTNSFMTASRSSAGGTAPWASKKSWKRWRLNLSPSVRSTSERSSMRRE